MANTILHKRNSTPGTVPTSGALSQGELGINIGDGKLYTKNSSNVVINLGVSSISGTYITPASGNFNYLAVSGVPVSVSGHSHLSVPQAESIVTNVFNKTASTIPKFSVVYINGGQGDQPTIQLAIANGEIGSSNTYAITAEAISSMSTGRVIVAGALSGINTDQFNPTAPAGDVNGVTLYLSPSVSGAATTTKPYAPNHLVSIGNIVRTHQNEGVVEVKIQNGFELQELHNVAVTGATNGQFLQYNSGSGLWVPSSSGNFTSLSVNNTGVSLSGHTHSSSDITNFNSSVSGLLPTGTANYLSKFGTGGSGLSNSLVFDNGTNVGIGTSSPSYKLDVAGDAEFGSNNWLKLIDTGSNNGRLVFSNIGSIDSAGAFLFRNNAGTTERMRITTDGNVGIGTTTPSGQLHVAGLLQGNSVGTTGIIVSNFHASQGANGQNHTSLYVNPTFLTSSSNLNNTYGLLISPSSSGQYTTTNSYGLYVNASTLISGIISNNYSAAFMGGNVGVGTAAPSARLEVAASGTTSLDIAHFSNSNGVEKAKVSLSSAGDGTLSLIDASNNTNIFFTSNTSTASYINAGNVGIGTTTPSTLLEISKDGGAVDLSLVRIANTNATGGTSLNISRTGPQRAAQVIYQSGTTNQFYQGILRDGGSTTNGWSVSAGSDLNVVAPAIHVTSGNYVGIGTKSPQVLLHVNGQAYLQSLNLTGGTADRILATDTNKNVVGLNTSTYPTLTELGYVKGATSSIQTQLDTKAPLSSPAFTGTPTAPTASSGTNTTQIATTAFVRTEISNLVDSAPGTLDTLNELAAALGDDPNFATTVTNSLASKISATGTANYIAKFSGSQTATNSIIFDNGTNVGIGTTTPTYKLQVNGSFAASTKSFRIDHPSKSGWNLEYGSLESPYHGVRLTGRGTVVKGVGVVSLPDYLKDLIHDDDTLNIQITNIKHGKTIYLEEIDLKNDRFIVKVDRAKSLGELQFCWTLTGVRKDVDHLVVEKEN